MRPRRITILDRMRKIKHQDDLDRMHWEGLVRTMIELIGVEAFDEIMQYVIEQMNAERRRLYHFAVETQRASH